MILLVATLVYVLLVVPVIVRWNHDGVKVRDAQEKNHFNEQE